MQLLLRAVPFLLLLGLAVPARAQAPVCSGRPTAIAASSETTIQIIPASITGRVRICKIVFTSSSAFTMTIKSGTGTLCATGTTSHTGAMPIQPSGIIDENIQLPMLIAGNVAVCLSFGGSTTGGGYVFFAY